ncbi:DinB family protein [Halobacillus kuroshimensis]|uniref:DinB family protein n=1 Tax=Halobacillus kuroshimensis TaxID=302481 RepID=A0ABS3DX34_9BACI|nr:MULTISPECIES: DinB family protein [Halobacillus]MBN8235905.1 DinB family protein [Halobacillus kuroshimensis]
MYGLDEKRKQLLEYAHSISDEKAARKPGEGKWSVLEILEHLYLMEQLVVYQIKQAIKQGDIQQTSEKPIHRTTERHYKVEAPESVRPEGTFQTIAEAEDGLKKTREATLFLIHNKDEETLKNRVFPHPAFGDMDLTQWIEFIGWHELRHLDQMKETVEAL